MEIVSASKRVKTGILGLDIMLSGGLLPGRPYIVSGPIGSGKTTLCIQFLLQGIKMGENVLFVAVDEPPNEIIYNARSFGWNVDDIKILDATSDIRRLEPTPVLDITSKSKVQTMAEVDEHIRKTPDFESVVVTIHSLQQTLRQITDRTKFDRMVIDSITGLKFFCMEGMDESISIQSFMRFLSELKITTLVTAEIPEIVLKMAPEIFLSKGEIRLHRWKEGSELKRGISIEMLRGSKHEEVLYPMEITDHGIVVYYGTTI